MKHADRDALLAALLAGELSIEDPQVRARLAAEPELMTMYENMNLIATAVARAGREQHEILTATHETLDRDLVDRVGAAVQQVITERVRRRRRQWLAAAALLLAVFGIGGYLLQRAPPAPVASGDMFLGDDEGLQPRGVVDDFRLFRWDTPRPAGGRFEVRIYEWVGGKRGRLLPTPDEENLESPWLLPSDVEAALPNEIYWELHVFGDDLQVLHAHARRRPH